MPSVSLLNLEWHSELNVKITGNNLSMQIRNGAKKISNALQSLCLPRCTKAFSTVTGGYEKIKVQQMKKTFV